MLWCLRGKLPRASLLALALAALATVLAAPTLAAGTGVNGFTAADYVTGLAYPTGIAFDHSGNLYVVSHSTGSLYKVPPGGGAPSQSAAITGIFGLAFGADGTLYATANDSANAMTGGRVIAIDPATLTPTAVIAMNASMAFLGLATDPLSGDLFVSTQLPTAAGAGIYRIALTTGNVSLYTGNMAPYPGAITLVDGLAFGPDGALYAAVKGSNQVTTIAGTAAAAPGTVLASIPVDEPDGVAVAPDNSYLLVNRNDGAITKVDRTTTPPTLTDIVTSGSYGDFATAGPDGCFYATQTNSVERVALADGTCPFAYRLALTPATGIAPVGTPHTVTATLTYAGGTTLNNQPIAFTVTGSNPGSGTGTTDTTGQATFTYTGTVSGPDTIIACYRPTGTCLASATVQQDWTGSATSLAVAAATGTYGGTTTLAATLTADGAPVAGAAITFSLHGTVVGTALTDANGVATLSNVSLSGIDAGTYAAAVTAAYAGDGTDLPSNGSNSLTIARAASTTAVTVPVGAIYDGMAHTATAQTTGIGGAMIASPTVSYIPGPGAPVNAGSYTASASFAGDTNYLPSSDSASFTIAQATPTTTITASNATYDGAPHGATAQTTGVGNPPAVLSPTEISYSGRNGTSYGPAPTAPTNAGDYTATASYAGDVNDTASAPVSADFTIAQATPRITWPTPAAIIFGTPLSSTQLNATATTLGSFVYTPPAGAILKVGSGQVLSVAFAPTDTTNYTTATATTTISVQYASGGTCAGAASHTVLQPVNANGTSVFKQGSTVPVKFRVCDANGVSIGTAGVVTDFRLVQVTTGTASAIVNEPVDSTTPDTTFRWDVTDQQWLFNLNTKGLEAGATYTYRITLNDGTTITFAFGLK